MYVHYRFVSRDHQGPTWIYHSLILFTDLNKFHTIYSGHGSHGAFAEVACMNHSRESPASGRFPNLPNRMLQILAREPISCKEVEDSRGGMLKLLLIEVLHCTSSETHLQVADCQFIDRLLSGFQNLFGVGFHILFSRQEALYYCLKNRIWIGLLENVPDIGLRILVVDGDCWNVNPAADIRSLVHHWPSRRKYCLSRYGAGYNTIVTNRQIFRTLFIPHHESTEHT